ncbi:hypothetical protein LZ32DRAFT_35605 [Colletotrichum eremochloae]|nr:hypothetical protein LZ32DRAFT_35605 [Colletotrichum eremochloae]
MCPDTRLFSLLLLPQNAHVCVRTYLSMRVHTHTHKYTHVRNTAVVTHPAYHRSLFGPRQPAHPTSAATTVHLVRRRTRVGGARRMFLRSRANVLPGSR